MFVAAAGGAIVPAPDVAAVAARDVAAFSLLPMSAGSAADPWTGFETPADPLPAPDICCAQAGIASQAAPTQAAARRRNFELSFRIVSLLT